MKRRIYTDTSVIGGCCDDEFRDGSLALFEGFRAGTAVIVVSDITQEELQTAPEHVRKILLAVPPEHIDFIRFTDEARDLAEAYMREGVVTRKSRADARHIAIATVSRVDMLVSWNFRHIVNSERIRGYNAVNLRLGYPLLEIIRPDEVSSHEDQIG